MLGIDSSKRGLYLRNIVSPPIIVLIACDEFAETHTFAQLEGEDVYLIQKKHQFDISEYFVAADLAP